MREGSLLGLARHECQILLDELRVDNLDSGASDASYDFRFLGSSIADQNFNAADEFGLELALEGHWAAFNLRTHPKKRP